MARPLTRLLTGPLGAPLRRLERVLRHPWPVRQTHVHGDRLHNRAARGAPGVNLIGYGRGEFGIGQHLRCVAAALEAAGVPVAVLDHSTTLHPRNDRSLDALFSSSPRYDCNLFCLNNDRVLALWDDHRLWFRERYNIGYGYWELSSYPRAWLPALNILDELWAPSRHLREVLEPVATVPLVHMPLGVLAEATGDITRRELGLPEESFAFCFVFDFSSTAARKNPEGVVQAFRRAFPPDDRSVSLLLKTKTNEEVAYQCAGRRALLDAAGDDERIVVVDRVLKRSQVLDLVACCDAFVSLHRAEGFGLGMAEAMALGKPVIATAYSGNLDFMDASCAQLVDFSLVPVPEGAAFGLEGDSLWAEPDLAQAAAAMRRLAENREQAATLGQRGRARIRELFSPNRAGERMRARLHYLGLLA